MTCRRKKEMTLNPASAERLRPCVSGSPEAACLNVVLVRASPLIHNINSSLFTSPFCTYNSHLDLHLSIYATINSFDRPQIRSQQNKPQCQQLKRPSSPTTTHSAPPPRPCQPSLEKPRTDNGISLAMWHFPPLSFLASARAP